MLAELIGQGAAAAGVWAGIFGGIASIAAVMIALPLAKPDQRAVTDEGPVPLWAVSRPAEVRAVVTAVVGGKGNSVTVLHGAPGFGKTTLTYLARADRIVKRRFGRHVYRITVGRGVVGDAAIAAKVNEAIRAVGEEGRFTEPGLAGGQLGALLNAEGRCLLILDDVWTPEQLAPFTAGGRRCARLVTSRAPLLPADHRVEIGALADAQAREVLGKDLPWISPDTADQLLDVTRRWPLLLRLANQSLAVRVRAGDSVAEAAADFLAQIQGLGPGGSDPVGQAVEPDDPKIRVTTVEATMQASLAFLSPQQANRLDDLAVFGPGQVIPFALAIALWARTANLGRQEAAETAQVLCDLGVASWTGPGRLRLHEVIGDYLRSRLSQPHLADLHGQLVDGAGTLVPTAEPLAVGQAAPTRAWWQQGNDQPSDAERYLDENLLAHLMQAGRMAAAEDLVCDLRWVSHRLATAGAASALADLEAVGTERACSLGGVIRRVMHMLGEDVVAADQSQFLFNALRSEPLWADQAQAVQGMLTGASLISRWPLPDNPGPVLLYVCNVPWTQGNGGAMALSPDGLRLLIAGRGGGYSCDLATKRVALAFNDQPGEVRAIGFSADGSLVGAVEGYGRVVVRDAQSWNIQATVADDGGIWTAAFTADGTGLITAGDSGRVKLWNTGTGLQVRPDDTEFFPRFVRPGFRSQPSRVAVVSGDGRRVISGSQGRVIIWSLPDGIVDRVLRTGRQSDNSLFRLVTASPSCSWVAGAEGEMIFLWRDSDEPAAMTDVPSYVVALAAARDGSRLAAANSHGTLFVWDSRDFTRTHRLEGHSGVESLEFSPDGQVLYSGGGGEIRAWDLRAAAGDFPVRRNSPATQILVPGMNAKWLAVGLKSDQVQIRDADSGVITAYLAGSGSYLASAPDGSWLATQSSGKITVYDTERWQPTAAFNTYWSSFLRGVQASTTGSQLLTWDDLALRVLDPQTGQIRVTATTMLREPRAVTFSPDGSWLTAGDYYGSIWVWQTESGELLRTMRTNSYDAGVQSLAAMDGETLLAYSANEIETWNFSTGNRIKVTPTEVGYRRVALAPDGHMLLASARSLFGDRAPGGAEDDGGVRVRYVTGGDETGLAFSADGRYYAVSSDSGTEIRETQSGRSHAVVPVQGLAIALSRDGSRLATGERSSTRLQLWDIADAAMLRSFDLGHGLNAVAFSPAGDLLAIAYDDGMTSWVSIVDASSGSERRLCSDLAQLRTVAESPDGRHLATVGSRGVRLWDMKSGRGICDPYQGEDAYLAAFGRDWLAVAIVPSGLRVFPLSENGQVRDLRIEDWLSELSVTPDGMQILALSRGGRLLRVDMPVGMVTVLAEVGPSAQTMAISPDGRWVAVGSYGVAIFRLRDGAPMTTHGLNRLVKSLAWSPDSTSIAVAGDGGSYHFAFSAGRQ